jgi:hypothetical protein
MAIINIPFKYALRTIAHNSFKSVVDNAIRSNVSEPAIGAVVYCDLALGHAEHSGIYIGDGLIAHLNKFGFVEAVGRKEFIAGTPAISIYTSCFGSSPIGCQSAATHAKHAVRVKEYRPYNLLSNNCHIFTTECITKEKRMDTFLWMVKEASKKVHGTDNWRVWKK